MNELNTKHEALTVPYASPSDPGPARRLIVPIQDPEADITAVAQRVWQLANSMGADIKFIGICNDTPQELSLRRTLTTLSAMVNDDNIYAESEIIRGKDLVNVVRSRVQPGDTVVCWRDYRTEPRRTMSPLLQADLGAPIYFLSELAVREISRADWMNQIIAWIGFIAIMVGFFWLQVEIGHLEWMAATVLQLLSIAGEIGLIWIWNVLLG